MQWISNRIFALVDTALGNMVSDAITKKKYDIMKTKLREQIQKDIINKYGYEVFYNRLDGFLECNNVIDNFIQNCITTGFDTYISSDKYVERISSNFIKANSGLSGHSPLIKQCIKELFDTIFNAFNDSGESEEIRIIVNHLKEYCASIESDLANYNSKINKKLDDLAKIQNSHRRHPFFETGIVVVYVISIVGVFLYLYNRISSIQPTSNIWYGILAIVCLISLLITCYFIFFGNTMIAYKDKKLQDKYYAKGVGVPDSILTDVKAKHSEKRESLWVSKPTSKTTFLLKDIAAKNGMSPTAYEMVLKSIFFVDNNFDLRSSIISIVLEHGQYNVKYDALLTPLEVINENKNRFILNQFSLLRSKGAIGFAKESRLTFLITRNSKVYSYFYISDDVLLWLTQATENFSESRRLSKVIETV